MIVRYPELNFFCLCQYPAHTLAIASSQKASTTMSCPSCPSAQLVDKLVDKHRLCPLCKQCYGRPQSVVSHKLSSFCLLLEIQGQLCEQLSQVPVPVRSTTAKSALTGLNVQIMVCVRAWQLSVTS